MSSKSEVTLIAEAILGNIRLIELLIAKLPTPTVEAVAKEVAKANPTPVTLTVQESPTVAVTPPAPAPAPVVTAAPAPVSASPSSPAPAPTPAPVPAAAPVAPPAATAGACPITTPKDLITYVMTTYKALGPTEGMRIQGIMEATTGQKNINDVPADKYAPFWQGVEALKASLS